MKILVGQGGALVRMGPGEVLHDAVYEAFEQSGRTLPVVVSCIGSVAYLDYGVATCSDRGIPGPGARFVRDNDAIEVGGIHGHVGLDDKGAPSAHLHGVMFGPDGTAFGGHVFEARVLITMELALIRVDGARWMRVHEPVNGSSPLPLLIPTASEV